jgi:hypothetical protein
MINDGKTIRRLAVISAASPLLGAVLLALAVMNSGAQQIPIAGAMSDFSSAQYFDPPHQQQMKSRISGAQAQQITEELWLIKQVKIEKFDVDGKLQIVAEAPECDYDRITAVANSPGELHIRSGDGQLRIDGEGFLWRQEESLLTISNQVQTVIKKGPAFKP